MKIYDLDFSINLLGSILWQYNDADKLQRLMQSEADFFNREVKEFWRGWRRDVFDLNTANAFGLSVWAIILGVSQDVRLNNETPENIFGFAPAEGYSNTYQNYNHGNFIRSENVLQVKAEQMRMLLKIRAMQLVSNGSLYDINRMLKMVFGVKAYAVDNFDMSMTYMFERELTADEQLVVQESDALVPPAAVKHEILFTRPNNWGFAPFRKNYNYSNLY